MELVKTPSHRQLARLPCDGNDKVAKVSAVGIGMRSHVGVASKMFNTLSQAGVNIPNDFHLGNQNLRDYRRQIHGIGRA